jgi:cytidylate kinase
MAILTVSRQVASLGDEICSSIAQKLNYRFFGRKDIEDRIVKLGFPKSKLKKFDEKKPGFFASLTRDRDEYLDYLQSAMLELASNNNCILIGRGSSIILRDLPNHVSCRFVSSEGARVARVMKEFSMDEKAAQKRIRDFDAEREGFMQSYFNVDVSDPSIFNFVMNSSSADIDTISEMLAIGIKKMITPELEKSGMDRIDELLVGQRIVNLLVLVYQIDINYLRATLSVSKNGKRTVTLHGIAASSAIVERALKISSCELPEFNVESEISVVQDYKAYVQ